MYVIKYILIEYIVPGGISECDTTGFERRVRQDCTTVYDTVCETVDKVKYRYATSYPLYIQYPMSQKGSVRRLCCWNMIEGCTLYSVHVAEKAPLEG